ncbi:MAG: hypothetical protein QM813_12640 [Verrucomicrobiota bacterium]
MKSLWTSSLSLVKPGSTSATMEGHTISGLRIPRAWAALWRSMMARLQATEKFSRDSGGDF